MVAKRAKLRCFANQELKIGKFLFERDINVPEMYEVIELKGVFSPEGEDLSGDYVLMERIKGVIRRDLTNSEEIEEAQEKLIEEIRKVKSLGVWPCDAYKNKGNSLFDRESRKVYLIDLEHWTFMEWENEN